LSRIKKETLMYNKKILNKLIKKASNRVCIIERAKFN